MRRLAPIRMAQRAGFTLAGIRALLDTGADRGATRQWRALAESELPEPDRFIRTRLLTGRPPYRPRG